MKIQKKTMKKVSWMLLTVLVVQLVLPNIAFALTTGPSQPEVQSFEPVGTTDMVDMFSGDFVYNIPLMDIEGYPVNIAYHGGVTMEQEASWVGLGWNINPGQINHIVRGVPDDFNGETIYKELHIKDDITTRVGVGGGCEHFGVGDPARLLSIDGGLYLNFNNYRGVSCDLALGAGINIKGVVSAGLNIGVGSQSGADIDYNADFHNKASNTVSEDVSGGYGVGVSNGINSRTGLKDFSFSVHGSASSPTGMHANTGNRDKGDIGLHKTVTGTGRLSLSATLPISMNNFIPVITNSTTMTSIFGRLKFGLEAVFQYPYAKLSGMYTVVHFNNDASRKSYGYLYLENADSLAHHSSVLDFTRDRDGTFNRTMNYLPPGNMAYDVYSAAGQGVGGIFRPYRNDFGSVFDPYTHSYSESNSLELEAGVFPNIFEVGGDFSVSKTDISSGSWDKYDRRFTKKRYGSIFENVYLRGAGELTSVDDQYFSSISGNSPIIPDNANNLPAIKDNADKRRDPRGNLVYYFTGEEASKPGVGSNPNILSYSSLDGFSSGPDPVTDTIKRVGASLLERKKDQLSEVVQVQKDGRRYVYGLPVINHVQKEATFSVDPPSTDGHTTSDGLVSFTPGTDDAVTNGNGVDNYYSSSTIPSYAHSYLLTSVLSTDYIDVTGNGISDDDLGSYTKFNYSLKQNDYRWRAPYMQGKAQYNPGFRSDPRDDKGSYVTGSREEWMLHSIESRNFIAEFYTSEKNDGAGSTAPIALNGPYAIAPFNNTSTKAPSYKLDSLKLYNKHDRFINGTSAVPIKTTFFVYTDSLCRGIPNSIDGSPSAGKLTLSKIYFRYGNSDKSLMSPYQFSYGYNPGYDFSRKDRWGNFKPNAGLGNFDFPFVRQEDPNLDLYASAWSLTKITLPSGGVIEANYEADDYAYVQDKEANEMFMLQGIGNTPNFVPNNILYNTKKSTNLFLYYKRRTWAEFPSETFKNYVNAGDVVYYNCNVKMVSNSEQVKGYAKAVEAGICPNNTDYGYIKLQEYDPMGGGKVRMNPITLTAINVGRYNLPQLLYPASDPSADLGDALAGLIPAIGEISSIWKNPMIHFLKKSIAKDVRLEKSYIRLKSPGLHKKGGGQRVKSLLFYDAWNTLAGGNEFNATYGKKYDYTTIDNGHTISSGVASYEPLIGGDENPIRKPVVYHASEGRTWPPLDPIELYQEEPIGETLYPGGSVGYSKVTVSSIHELEGRSSQGEDVLEFYTAYDFPIHVENSGIDKSEDYHFKIFSQKNMFYGKQGYALTFNDMHGKQKSVAHYVKRPTGGTHKISGTEYIYKHAGNKLDNRVACLVFNNDEGVIKTATRQLGVEVDVTIDTRSRDEISKRMSFNLSYNVSSFGFVVIPIVFGFSWPAKSTTEFRSATVTKVIQQYGILSETITYNEGATIHQLNELFDPETGDVLVSSVKNEYEDKEYTTNIPGYWSYAAMKPAYSNIKYENDIYNVVIDTNHLGSFSDLDPNLMTGDELFVTYPDGSSFTAWYMGSKMAPIDGKLFCRGNILPRFPLNTSHWNVGDTIPYVHIMVVRSGGKNMLNTSVESYTSTMYPVDVDNNLMQTLEVINIKAATFCDSNTSTIHNYLANADSINPYAIGQRGIYRMLTEYAYVTDRQEGGGHSRTAGIFKAPRLYSNPSGYDRSTCDKFPYNYISPSFDAKNWRAARTVTKWSPFGVELENKDALGNYSAIVTGYNDDLPVAVASNARQGEIIADGFEDYGLLRPQGNIMSFSYSFYTPYFGAVPLPVPSAVYKMLGIAPGTDLSIRNTESHTGQYSLYTQNSSPGASTFTVQVPINFNNYSGMHSRYNTYYDYSSYTFSSNNEYLPFMLPLGKKMIISLWVKDINSGLNPTTYNLHPHCGIEIDGTLYRFVAKSNIIDGWQQMEAVCVVPLGAHVALLQLPVKCYMDDMRIFPADANMKSFVYHPVNERLVATLDENNFAKMYEYDQEGNLVRVKKETEKGIMTVSESRSNQPNH